MSDELVKKKTRDSNIELLRIIMMIIIVGHHYVVNSGITELININIIHSSCGIKDYFALVFGKNLARTRVNNHSYCFFQRSEKGNAANRTI